MIAGGEYKLAAPLKEARRLRRGEVSSHIDGKVLLPHVPGRKYDFDADGVRPDEPALRHISDGCARDPTPIAVAS
jgi:hypothetical protein